jgi:hypothetical protein
LSSPSPSNTDVFAKVQKTALAAIYSGTRSCCDLEGFTGIQLANITAGVLYKPPFPTIDQFTASNPKAIPNR